MSPIISPSGGGGGTQPAQATYNGFGSPVTIPHGTNAALSWGVKASGSDLLNLTAPTAPSVVTAGVYAVTIIVVPNNGLVNQSYSAELALDTGTFAAYTAADSAEPNAGANTIRISLSLTGYIPAGGVIQAYVTNNQTVDGDFSIDRSVIQLIR